MTARRRKPTEEEKKKLDNSEIPLVTREAARKAFERGDEEEANRLLNFLYDPKKHKRK